MIKTLNKRQIKMNKGRMLMTIMAIMLTCILLTSVLTMSSHLLVSMQDTSARQMGSSAHVGFKQLDYATAMKVKEHELFTDSGISEIIGLLEDEKYNKRMVEVRTMDDDFRTFMYMDLVEGRMPFDHDEIVVDQEWLYYNSIDFGVGDVVHLNIKIGKYHYDQDFTIVGIAEGNRIGPVSNILLSDELADELMNKYSDVDHIGTVQVLGNFNSKFNMKHKLMKIAKDYKLDIESTRGSVNPAYQIDIRTINPTDIIGFVLVFLVLMFSGYLIIFNIYYIGVTKEVRYYGLLKTIGMTSKQIKAMVLRYNLRLTLLGLPLGLIIGYTLGSILIPIVINTLNIEHVKYSYNIWVFIFSAILTLLTTYLSCRKPARIAAHVSPIEALRTFDIQYNKKAKISKKGSVKHLAWRSLFSNKRKAVMVIVSLALSMTILMSVSIIVSDVDPNEMIKSSIGTDYIIGHYQYFEYNYNRDPINNVVPESALTSLGEHAHPIYLKDERVALNDNQRDAILTRYDADTVSYYVKEIREGHINMSLFSVDDFILDLLADYVVEGEIPDKLGANQIIIDKHFFTDAGMSTLPIEAGESLLIDGIEYEIVAAVNNLPMYLYEQSYSGSWIKGYKVGNYGNLMNVMGNGEINKKSIETSFPNIVVKSREDFLEEVENYIKMVRVIGYTLSAILFAIGLLNFINMQATSILMRRKMFAVLESIGMKKIQLKQMLVYEGTFIAGFAAIISMVLSILIQLLIGNSFSLIHLTSGVIFIIILSVIILLFPLIVYNVFCKSTIVERLRGDE